MDLTKIEKAETSIEYWKDEALFYWQRYLRNVQIVKNLREQNRQLRRLLSDYTN